MAGGKGPFFDESASMLRKSRSGLRTGDGNMGEWKAVRVGDEPAQGLGEGGARESGSVRGLAQHVGRR